MKDGFGMSFWGVEFGMMCIFKVFRCDMERLVGCIMFCSNFVIGFWVWFLGVELVCC